MLTTGFDLGIFEQVVRCYAHGRLPVVDLKGPGFQELGDHFSPILATLAPLYRAWPSPAVLLLAQAALFALAVVPLARWAQRAMGPAVAWAVGLGYGASWGIASAVGFDFHEVCFAVPLLAFSLAALGQGRLRAASGWSLPLLLVKEDLGLTVAVIGVLIAWRGGRRLGWATAAAGLVGSALEVLVVIPAFNPGGHYTYLDGLDSAPAGASGLPGQLYRLTVGLVAAPDPKALTLVLLLAPTAFLALRSALLWAAVPTLVWRFASDNPLYWGTNAQYSAVLMPVVFAAFLDALARRPADARSLRHYLVVQLAVTALLLPQFPLVQLAQPGTWRADPRIAGARRIMDLIPDGASVAAGNRLVPQLTDRATVTEFGLSARPAPRWIMLDTATPQGWPITAAQQADLVDRARTEGYRTVADADGFLLLHLAGEPSPR
ncbi:DUF2079 domain-containing protein [Streptacidiphilus sp. PB12-B1b]|nr:DUF2079 domain-containing protein [Streptacidiphilus sp. PB12-B1b]